MSNLSPMTIEEQQQTIWVVLTVVILVTCAVSISAIYGIHVRAKMEGRWECMEATR